MRRKRDTSPKKGKPSAAVSARRDRAAQRSGSGKRAPSRTGGDDGNDVTLTSPPILIVEAPTGEASKLEAHPPAHVAPASIDAISRAVDADSFTTAVPNDRTTVASGGVATEDDVDVGPAASDAPAALSEDARDGAREFAEGATSDGAVDGGHMGSRDVSTYAAHRDAAHADAAYTDASHTDDVHTDAVDTAFVVPDAIETVVVETDAADTADATTDDLDADETDADETDADETDADETDADETDAEDGESDDAESDDAESVDAEPDDELSRAESIDAVISTASDIDAVISAPIEGLLPDDDDDDAFESDPALATAAEHDASQSPDGAGERTAVASNAAGVSLAQAIDDACDDTERDLQIAVDARHDQQLAWLVLCDRGWPSDRQVPDRCMPAVRGWLSAWSEYCALPVKADGLLDRFRLRGILQRLEKAEAALRPSIPAALWRLVHPLDATGRATLAYAMQGIVLLAESNARCDAATRHKARHSTRFTALGAEARERGMEPPEALLDVDAWRRMAVRARRGR